MVDVITRVHPECEPSCTHQRVSDLGGKIVQRGAHHDRAASEAILRAKYPGARLAYLGISPEHERHTWRLGGRAWKPGVRTEAAEGKQAKREVTYLYRPAVWEGSGEPVGPIDFSRPAQQEEQPYPVPSLTSDMQVPITASQPASGLQALARANGWDAVITFARGYLPHATHGRPSAAEKVSEAVRMARGSRRAVAVRMDGSWTSLWTWSDTEFFTRHATLEAFKRVIAQPVHKPVDNVPDQGVESAISRGAFRG